MDPLCGSTWSEPGTVAGFADAPPNEALMTFAARERRRGGRRAVDVGCGAGRNLIPLAHQGWTIVGVDLSRPMIDAAAGRLKAERLSDHARVALAPMDALPVASQSVDLVVAHGIWNLARSDAELRRAMSETARIALPGAGLFVFTFSRTTLPAAVSPISGESFVFTGFSGRPQCFLTEDELVAELASVGFILDPAVPLTEHNLPHPASIRAVNVPVIFEAAFRFNGGRTR